MHDLDTLNTVTVFSKSRCRSERTKACSVTTIVFHRQFVTHTMHCSAPAFQARVSVSQRVSTSNYHSVCVINWKRTDGQSCGSWSVSAHRRRWWLECATRSERLPIVSANRERTHHYYFSSVSTSIFIAPHRHHVISQRTSCYSAWRHRLRNLH